MYTVYGVWVSVSAHENTLKNTLKAFVRVVIRQNPKILYLLKYFIRRGNDNELDISG